jgi:hypothetical protein
VIKVQNLHEDIGVVGDHRYSGLFATLGADHGMLDNDIIRFFMFKFHFSGVGFDTKINTNGYKGVLLFSIEAAAILDFIINLSFYNLSNNFNNFFDPENIGLTPKSSLCVK